MVLPCIATAAELRIYQLELQGPAPEPAAVQGALDEKSMPGMAVYSGKVEEDGKFLIDQTLPDLSTPVPLGEEPRRTGVVLEGELRAAEKEAGVRRILFAQREMKHTFYVFAPKVKQFVPARIESSTSVAGKIGKDGWCVIDTDPESKEARRIFIVRVTD